MPSLAKSGPWYKFLRPQVRGGNLRFPWLAAEAAVPSRAQGIREAPGILVSVSVSEHFEPVESPVIHLALGVSRGTADVDAREPGLV